MSDNLFRWLAMSIFVIGAGISVYYRRKADRATRERISLHEEGWAMVAALRLAGLAVWMSIFAWLLNPGWTAWAHFDLPEWMRWLGVALGVGGDLLAAWIFTNLGNNVTPTVVTRSNARLVTSGPYRYVRHPLYLMGLIGYLGFALLAENWFVALVSIVAFVLLSIRVEKEEAHLIEKFGDEYRSYMKTTGRFLPRLPR